MSSDACKQASDLIRFTLVHNDTKACYHEEVEGKELFGRLSLLKFCRFDRV